jgi:hypothetical protein
VGVVLHKVSPQEKIPSKRGGLTPHISTHFPHKCNFKTHAFLDYLLYQIYFLWFIPADTVVQKRCIFSISEFLKQATRRAKATDEGGYSYKT